MADDENQGGDTPQNPPQDPNPAPEQPPAPPEETPPDSPPDAPPAPPVEPDPAPTPPPEEPPAPLAPVEPPPEPPVDDTPPVLPPVSLDEVTSAALGSKDFADFIGDSVMKFLDIVDIANPNQRRGALLALNLGEDGIKARIELARAFLHVQTVYGVEFGAPELVDRSIEYSAKINLMIEWLGM